MLQSFSVSTENTNPLNHNQRSLQKNSVPVVALTGGKNLELKRTKNKEMKLVIL